MPAPQTRHRLAPEFLDAAHQFVQLAKPLADTRARDWVRAALMYAAVRSNAFVWPTREDNFDQGHDDAATDFASQYEKMWRDNVEELTLVYRSATPGMGQAGAASGE